MANRVFHAINTIFSFMGRIIKHLSRNWTKYRKVLVAITFLGLFFYQLSTPEVKKSLTKGISFSILQTEKSAKDYVTKKDLKSATIQYTNAVAMIISQKDADVISISPDIQYRICTDAAKTFIKYAYYNTLDDTDIKNGTTILNGLHTQKEVYNNDVSLDSLIIRLDRLLQSY